MLAGAALFGRLGFWQLDRAEEKRALLTQYEAGRHSTLTLTMHSADALPRYQHVQARGRYDSTQQILLENMPSAQGRAGYRVLTPLELTQGEWILVDRGWIAPGATRADAPHVGVSDAPRDVTGRLDHLPEPGLRLGENTDDESRRWPRAFTFPVHEQLVRALGRPLATRILLLDAAQPDGYERTTQAPFRAEPARHVAYAVQWFAFALLAIILYVIISMKPRTGAPESVDPRTGD